MTLIPAAQYLRMSTEEQTYSIDNQKCAIEKFAQANQFQIIRTYTDAGRSGLTIARRSGLKELLHDVVSGDAKYKVVLVYDVSRWGRFQDLDETGHYEFLCREAGVEIHYCVEPFVNDNSVVSAMGKALKRSMAAEYSRELGVRVHQGQRRVASLGFRGGGAAPYGLSRAMISPDGKIQRVLKRGEWKGVHSSRVILVPGPTGEVQCVRKIFRMAATEELSPFQIAKRLNKGRFLHVKNFEWTAQSIWRVLRNAEYMGSAVWGRTITRLQTGCHRATPSEWVTKPGAFTPIVDDAIFLRAQRLIEARNRRPGPTESQLLDKLRKVLARTGRLNETIIHKAPNMFAPRTYYGRFGSLMRAYRLIGYSPPSRVSTSAEHNVQMYRLRRELQRDLQHLFPAEIQMVRTSHIRWAMAELDKRLKVSIYFCRLLPPRGRRDRWLLRIRDSERGNITLACLVDSAFSETLSYHVLPAIGNTIETHHVLDLEDGVLLNGKRLRALTEFCKTVREVAGR